MRRCPTCGRIYADPTEVCPEHGVALEAVAVAGGDRPNPAPKRLKKSPEARVGTVIGGRYALHRVLGHGASGAVYEAENTWTGRKVAVKVLWPELLNSKQLVARFVQEGRTAAQIQHPNIVDILDMGQAEDGSLYMVQEFLTGADLRSRIFAGALPLGEALDVVVPIMGALAAAHARGVVHRDVKPANIVLSKGVHGRTTVPKLIDFGIAKVLEDGQGSEPLPFATRLAKTAQGAVLGTPQYMSPEQLSAETIDARCDVWAIAAVFHEMITGRPAFRGDTMLELISAVIAGPVPSLADVGAVPPALAEIVARAFDRDRGRRWGSMRAFLDAMLDWSLSEASSSEPPLGARHAGSIPYERSEPRLPSLLLVSVEVKDWHGARELVASNVSRTGLFVESAHPPPVGSTVELRLKLPDSSEVKLRGVVQHVLDPTRAIEEGRSPGAGIKLDPEHEIDLLLLDQVAAAYLAPSFLSAAAPPTPSTAPPEPPPRPSASPPNAVPQRIARPQGAIAPAVGIDFGTTYSSVSVAIGEKVYLIADERGRSLHPSIVSYPDRGLPVVGWSARRAMVSDPSRGVGAAKRLLGRSFSDPMIAGYLASLPHRTIPGPNDSILIEIDGQPISPVQVSALILEHLRRLAERQIGAAVSRAVITAPLAFAERERAALKLAAERAGLDLIGLVDEPVAGAKTYAFGQQRNEIVAIYDFGGGTFDFSVLALRGDEHRILSQAGDAWLGGEDFDLRIAQHLADAFWRSSGVDLRHRAVEWQRLILASEQAKRALSVRTVAEVVVERVIETPERVDLSERIERADFERLTGEIVGRSITTCAEGLLRAGLRPPKIDRIVVTGGMSRVPMIQRELARFFGREITMAVNPEEAVCLGAGISAATAVGHRVRAAARMSGG